MSNILINPNPKKVLFFIFSFRFNFFPNNLRNNILIDKILSNIFSIYFIE